jgi:hypothetical protein
MTHSWRRTVESPEQLGALVYELGNMRQPFTVTVQRGKGRSLDQNALAWKWAQQIAAHFGDRTTNEVWGSMKLETGVPLLREHDPEFRESILALRGRRLVCFCKPLPCHGDIIVEYIEECAVLDRQFLGVEP